MARKSNPVAVITPEALAEAVPTVNLTAVANDLRDSFKGDQSNRLAVLFEQSRITAAAKASGASDEKLADLVTAAMLDTFPESERAYRATLSVDKGGATVTRVTIKQRRQAWEDLIEAGVVPTHGAVEAAFRLAVTGAKGLSDMRKRLAVDTLAQSADTREAFYIAESVSRLKALKDANKPEKAESAATASADEKAEDHSEPVALDTVGDFVLYLKATVARPWNDDDKATLSAALQAALDSLA